jgi:hypothetical protein
MASFPTFESSRGISRRTLGLSNHAIQFANIAIIITIHLLDEMKAHGFINLCVWLVSTRLKIASPAFRICLLSDFSEKSPSNPLSLHLWKYNNDIAKVIAFRIGPYESYQTLHKQHEVMYDIRTGVANWEYRQISDCASACLCFQM